MVNFVGLALYKKSSSSGIIHFWVERKDDKVPITLACLVACFYMSCLGHMYLVFSVTYNILKRPKIDA